MVRVANFVIYGVGVAKFEIFAVGVVSMDSVSFGFMDSVSWVSIRFQWIRFQFGVGVVINSILLSINRL